MLDRGVRGRLGSAHEGAAGGRRRHGEIVGRAGVFHLCHECTYCVPHHSSTPEEAAVNPEQTENIEQDVTATLTSEDLIEEVSIDGMCGVY
nr:mycofactocin precursor MftA [Nocardioides soli]